MFEQPGWTYERRYEGPPALALDRSIAGPVEWRITEDLLELVDRDDEDLVAAAWPIDAHIPAGCRHLDAYDFRSGGRPTCDGVLAPWDELENMLVNFDVNVIGSDVYDPSHAGSWIATGARSDVQITDSMIVVREPYWVGVATSTGVSDGTLIHRVKAPKHRAASVGMAGASGRRPLGR